VRYFPRTICAALLTLLSCYANPLPAEVLQEVELETSHDFYDDLWQAREQLQQGLVHNLESLGELQQSQTQIAKSSSNGPSLSHVIESLRALQAVLHSAASAEEVRERVSAQFRLLRSNGRDGRGNVLFTGYFQPSFKASSAPDAQYRYPIFRKPSDFESWTKPHPSRVALEGYQGLRAQDPRLQGLELAWLSSRWEAFMIHLQGSAILEMSDGERIAVGFAAGTQHPFRGMSKQMLQRIGLPWHKLGPYFDRNTHELDAMLSRNNRFIFFKELPAADALGSLGVPLIPERSIATDKHTLPPGALALIRTKIPQHDAKGRLRSFLDTRVVLDQDTGSAIKGSGRVDLFMGTGPEAQTRASSLYTEGELFYLLLKSAPSLTTEPTA
jgi:membrane-bound lytic murein transglycosylase A